MSGNSREKDGRSHGRVASSSPVPSPGRRLQSVAKEKQELQVNVGIDFGTSSTKVIFTDRHFMPRYVCTFRDNPEGYPPICLPSAVRVVDGKVYFGDEAERKEQAGPFIGRSKWVWPALRPTASAQRAQIRSATRDGRRSSRTRAARRT